MPGNARTETEVANLALAHVREPPIGDLSERSARADALRQHFGQARDETLAAAHWSFAKSWTRPARDPEAGLGPFKNRFPLPPDCIAVRFLDGVSREEWDIEAGAVASAGAAIEAVVLVTNAAEPLVCYTRRIETPALWSPQFCAAFALALAVRVAPELARSTNLLAALTVQYNDAVADAERQDGRQRRAETVSRDVSWVRARRGGRW